MHRTNPECPGSDHFDRWVAAHLLLRQEPEDDEEEDDGTDNDDDDDDENNDGYRSERVLDRATTSTRSRLTARPRNGLRGGQR
jgi:hypothetical protein